MKSTDFAFRRILLGIALLACAATSAHGQAVPLTDLPIQANIETDKDAIPSAGKHIRLFINTTPEGKELKIGDQSYKTGLSTRGGLCWSYALKGEYAGLVLDFGQQKSAILKILGDDKLLFNSGVLVTSGPATAVVDVHGVQELKVTVINLMGPGGGIMIGNPLLLKHPQSDAGDVQIHADRLPSVAVAKVSARVIQSGQAVQFDASESSSPGGPITDYQWDFGDGSKGEGKSVSHVYPTAGWYSAVLTVLNKSAVGAQTTVAIRVRDPAEASPLTLPSHPRILLIGSSRSGRVPGWLVTIDKLSPKPLGLTCLGAGKGVGKLAEYATWSSLAIHERIDQGWDVVILQPGFDLLDPVSDEQLLASCKTVVGWIRETGAFAVLYEPHHSFRNLAKDQARAHQRIMRLVEALNTGYVPAGQAWLRVSKELPLSEKGKTGQPGIDPETFDGLMFHDQVHPNDSGSLLNALMVWKYLTGQSPSAIKLSSTDKRLSTSKLAWDKLAYLEKVADESIAPASQRLH